MDWCIHPIIKKRCVYIAAIAIIVPLLLLSSIEFNGHNNTNLSLVKYALAQQGNNSSTGSNNSVSSNTIAPFVQDIISLAKQNTNFRQEIKTANHTQVVLMSLKPGEDIGLEVHKKIDQLLIFVQGTGEANIGGQKFPIREGTLAFVPAGTPHNFVNTGKTDLKLFTTYSPPNHAAGVLQKTKAETAGYVPKGAIEQEG
jgi:mannose-6-phosphate isomerase-like protein (cupin superfamily)